MLGPGMGKIVTSMICERTSIFPDDIPNPFRYDRDIFAAKKEALK